jgi:hypothetical protein
MSLGVHFALDAATEARLLSAADRRDDHAVLALIEEIEETWQERLTCHHARSWDPVHRCLTDGKLAYASGTYPLGAAILGGRQLMAGEQDFTISYVSAGQVRDVAGALEVIEENWFRERYYALAQTDYYGPVDEEDLNLTWADFEDTREFYRKAAEAGLSVIFTVDA